MAGRRDSRTALATGQIQSAYEMDEVLQTDSARALGKWTPLYGPDTTHRMDSTNHKLMSTGEISALAERHAIIAREEFVEYCNQRNLTFTEEDLFVVQRVAQRAAFAAASDAASHINGQIDACLI